MSAGRWGRAGVRLTAQEIARNNTRKARQTAARELARTQWAEGKLVPYRITSALNVNGLYGPEVDEACGVTEPAVDCWEAGTLYPTWEQLLALANLTGFPVGYFCKPPTAPLLVNETSLRFHRVHGARVDVRTPPPVRCFTPEAINNTLGGLW